MDERKEREREREGEEGEIERGQWREENREGGLSTHKPISLANSVAVGMQRYGTQLRN